jgi:transposase-like protein
MRQKKHTRGYRTDSEMYAHICAWEASGQTQKSYITAHGLSKSVFGYWLRRYRQEKQGGFVEVSVGAESAPARSSEGMFACLRTSQGAELVLYEAVSAAYLRELLW